MQYKHLTDCAIKGLRYLADVDKKCVTTFELADYLSMSRTTVQNFMRILRRNTKWIRSLSGTEGGYVFTGDAEKITLYAIHKAMEDEARSSDIVDRSDVMLYSICQLFYLLMNDRDGIFKFFIVFTARIIQSPILSI